MKVHLMYHDRDFEIKQNLPVNEQALTQDLELETLFQGMAVDDEFLSEVVKKAVFCGTHDLSTLQYRQDILKDCLGNPSSVREIYKITVEAIETRRQHYFGIYTNYPSSILYESVKMLKMLVDRLSKLKMIAHQQAERFESEGFQIFFTMLQTELREEYFTRVQNHLEYLELQNGALLRAELGKGNRGTRYTLVKPPDKKQSWMERMFMKKSPSYTFHISSRDESAARTLSEIKDRGLNLVANALAQSSDHILSFFNQLRTELAFYVGCLNLYERLSRKGEPMCFPLPMSEEGRRHDFEGLYDVCLTLKVDQKLVGNTVNADNKDLVVITGANQGGKSTFLRSLGLAQLMMQCGMFVPAESFCANVCKGLFTHFKREEDVTMKSGKFDEELSRMSEIADHITPNSMLLLNESFAATNEREGSEVAKQITRAMLENQIKVFYVTHLFEYAQGMYEEGMTNVLFLRAERRIDGTRTFHIIEGEPLRTSYGEDLYDRIFGV